MPRLQIQGKIPFQEAESHDTEECILNPESCALYRMLPANAKEYARNYPHLLEYLHIFPVDEFGIPLFFSELKRDLKGIKDPNLIYPAKPPIFIHIFFDPNDVRNFYIPIEPSFMHNIGRLLPAIEYRLVDLLDALEEDPVTPEERTSVLKRLLRQVMYIKKPGEAIDPALLKIEGPKGFGDKIKTFLTTDLTAKEEPGAERLFADVPHLADGRIIVTPQEFEAIEYQMIGTRSMSDSSTRLFQTILSRISPATVLAPSY
jgi:flagellar protein FlaI